MKNLVDHVRNGTWGQDPDDAHSGAVCVRAADFDRHLNRVDETKLVRRLLTPAEVAKHRLRRGDLVLEKSGGGERQPVGAAVLFDSDFTAVPTNFAARIRPAAHVDPRFLNYVLRATYGLGINQRSIKQTTGLQNLDADSFLAERWVAPDHEEQRAIADFLDRETARIDLLVVKRKTLLQVLVERDASVVDAVLDVKVEWSPLGVPMGLLGRQCVRLGGLAKVQSGLALDSNRPRGSSEITLPYLRVANVQDGWLTLEDLKEVTVPRATAERVLLRKGDVLMTEGGDPDKLGRGTIWTGDVSPCLHQNHIFAVRPNNQLVPEYLALLTRTSYARAYFEVTAAKTTGIASTSNAKIKAFRVPLLPVAEQEHLVHETFRALAESASLKRLVTCQVDKLHEHREALITAAVTGQIDVPSAA